MSNPKEQLFCYLRVSSQVQLDEGNSIDNQRFLGKKVSKQLGLEYVELNEESSSTNATGFNSLLYVNAVAS